MSILRRRSWCLENVMVDKRPDEINPRTLKEAREEIAGTLSGIFFPLLPTDKEVTKMINGSRAVDVVCMGFTEAFDRVPHGRLVQKIKSHEIHASAVPTISRFDRKPRSSRRPTPEDEELPAQGETAALGPLRRCQGHRR
eukprot:g28481.t1